MEIGFPALEGSVLRINAAPIDYVLVAIYFAIIIGIGLISRRGVSSSLDFLLAGRRLPAWVTGLAFMSANLGATELLGQAANGAQYGEQAFHYYWVGAIPAMVFLGLVMMPFYYGSKVRSVPEFLHRRFNRTTQRIQAVLFAVASILLAGVNLYAMAIVVNALLGWPTWVAILVAAVFVLAYTFLGGLSAAIYNEVLQFFVIVAAMIPVTIVGLHRVGGWNGLVSKISAQPGGHQLLTPFPGSQLTGITSSVGSIIGVVAGLGFVTSFGYWTTNFTEVQRAFSAGDAGAAQRTPLIAAIPKALVALVIIIPGMIATVLIPAIAGLKKGAAAGGVTYNDVVPLMLRELLPNGFLGVALTGLLASFMAGMAANVSSFNTVFTYDIWQDWIKPNMPDAHYLNVGRIVTVLATAAAVGTAFIAAGFNNIMDYIQTLFSFFNVPLFAVFILGLFWKRMTGTAGWSSLITGTAGAVVVFILNQVGVLNLPGQGSSFLGGAVACVLVVIVAVIVSARTKPKSDEELVGLVRSVTPKEDITIAVKVWYQSPILLAAVSLGLVIVFYIFFSLR
ncbi:solute:Na+ symporter, SSS family protein [Microlunatus endophyticus]|uniref:Solute:Na+ symporter, SSS family protein n=1 Tax=Microlunatus endophyticus TaxID=1716077 RepID=A0A917SD52_9ACTN|nr:sodium:solute symporter family protein [Microlunatus endophyticus]GGL68782.1 solute:Na+ symporter, SSS family protein [Microlunatus endophyticus]